ncbi:MAG: type II toxin-antitoxin system VapC family toxin [Kiritimatiellae bacterium]|nr:type II toxin-antitoxin system VapC family toxin [Kiritimatiellia bacterium]
MSKWVVDTCVIIDVLSGDGEFSVKSADAIDMKRGDGLVIAPITYVELAPSFDGDSNRQDTTLSELGIEFDFGGSKDAVMAAYKAWHDHVRRKRTGQVAKRPIADIMIGAYAMQKGGLITRNEEDFRSLYPNLAIFNPIIMAT